jgi:hypothetical protein
VRAHLHFSSLDRQVACLAFQEAVWAVYRMFLGVLFEEDLVALLLAALDLSEHACMLGVVCQELPLQGEVTA